MIASECRIPASLANHIPPEELPKLFHRPTATLPDPDAPPADHRYRTLALLNGIPVVATHTEQDSDACLLAIRPAGRAEAETLLSRLLEKLAWITKEVVDESQVPENPLPWETAQLRIGGESLDGVRLELTVAGGTPPSHRPAE
ncbi:hypothetical protein JCM17961_08330 [Endothiovibrio diazotrophicus]